MKSVQIFNKKYLL